MSAGRVEIQPELFPEGNPERKAKNARRNAAFIGPLGFTLNLTYDVLLLAAIGLIMFGLAAYSLGVERGRNLADRPEVRNSPKREIAKTAVSSPKTVPSTERTAIKRPMPTEAPAAREETVASVGVVSQTSSQETLKEQYAVQVATYKQRSYAEKEAGYLKGQGYTEVQVREHGEYYQVRVEGFENRALADKARKHLSVRYKDCFVKKD